MHRAKSFVSLSDLVAAISREAGADACLISHGCRRERNIRPTASVPDVQHCSMLAGTGDQNNKQRSYVQRRLCRSRRNRDDSSLLHWFDGWTKNKSCRQEVVSACTSSSFPRADRDVVRLDLQNTTHLSNSALSSDSVGSIMSVPGTGHDMVGLWKP